MSEWISVKGKIPAGNMLLRKSDIIFIEEKGKEETLVTLIYTKPYGVFEVRNTCAEIMKQLEEA